MTSRVPPSRCAHVIAVRTGHRGIDRTRGVPVRRLRSGHASGGQPVRGPESRAHALGHLLRDLGVNRSLAVEQPRVHLEQRRLLSPAAYATIPPTNVADDPGIAVSAWPSCPPVSDSATLTVAPRSARSRWTATSSVSSSAYTRSPSTPRRWRAYDSTRAPGPLTAAGRRPGWRGTRPAGLAAWVRRGPRATRPPTPRAQRSAASSCEHRPHRRRDGAGRAGSTPSQSHASPPGRPARRTRPCHRWWSAGRAPDHAGSSGSRLRSGRRPFAARRRGRDDPRGEPLAQPLLDVGVAPQSDARCGGNSSRVTSSDVGPRPPSTRTASALRAASRSASAISGISSGTVTSNTTR